MIILRDGFYIEYFYMYVFIDKRFNIGMFIIVILKMFILVNLIFRILSFSEVNIIYLYYVEKKCF